MIPSLELGLQLLVGSLQDIDVVDDLHGTEDEEAGEEPHGAADQTQLGLLGHLLSFSIST